MQARKFTYKLNQSFLKTPTIKQENYIIDYILKILNYIIKILKFFHNSNLFDGKINLKRDLKFIKNLKSLPKYSKQIVNFS
jgi:hypothetical protein